MTLRRNYARYGASTIFYNSIEEFVSAPLPAFEEYKAEAISIRYGTAFMDLLVENRGADTTIVLFHAAINPAGTSLPVFIGRQLVDTIDANLIYVSDPSLDHGTPIGWFTGDENRAFQEDLTQCLGHLEKNLHPDISTTELGRRMVFFGASAGGFAALYYSWRFTGSLAIVSNPQTHIGRYLEPQVKVYRQKCWSGRKLSETTMTFDLVEQYSQGFGNYVAYLQNRRDELHYSQHFLPWSEAASKHPDQWKLLLGDWGEGHAPAPMELLVGVLGFAASVNGDWKQLLNDEEFQAAP
ncbi:hypothetical protein ACUY2X_05270 [Corynebacterium minutissimum]